MPTNSAGSVKRPAPSRPKSKLSMADEEPPRKKMKPLSSMLAMPPLLSIASVSASQSQSQSRTHVQSQKGVMGPPAHIPGSASAKWKGKGRAAPSSSSTSQSHSQSQRRFHSPDVEVIDVDADSDEYQDDDEDANGGMNLDIGVAEVDDQLWVDKYAPQKEDDLAVHKKKVQDVRRWLGEAFEGGPAGRLRKYRRILALTGPAGTAKTATLRVLACELGCEVLEWRNGADAFDFEGEYEDRESLTAKFASFLARASACTPVVASAPSAPSTSISTSSAAHADRSTNANPMDATSRRIILLEDLPNILHGPTQVAFHDALQAFVDAPLPPSGVDAVSPPAPVIVIVVSDAGTRGDAQDERIALGSGSGSGVGGGGSGGGRYGKDVVDIRTVLPPALLNSAFVTQISFNPIAPTLMRRALQAMLDAHFSSSPNAPISSTPTPSSSSQKSKTRKKLAPNGTWRDILDVLVDSSNGDIRSAVMALQFSAVSLAETGFSNGSSLGPRLSGKGKDKGKGKGSNGAGSTRAVLEAVTRREQSLALFHLLGKVLYNKRKDDPNPASATAKDVERDRALDSRLRDAPLLPNFLEDAHGRRTSRVDVDTLYADSPVDSGLFGLYLAQNYTQFCEDIEQCEGVSEWLSWVDSSGGEQWHQANPHRFHLLTLGTLHSLPSPVPRRGQKMYKPAFFAALRKGRDAEDGVEDVKEWLLEPPGADTRADLGADAPGMMPVRTWTREAITTELGAVFRARDTLGASQAHPTFQPPPTHRIFTRLVFAASGIGGNQLAEEDGVDEGDANAMADADAGEEVARWRNERERWKRGVGLKDKDDMDDPGSGWLKSDDIDEF